jgi:hypothetical protein
MAAPTADSGGHRGLLDAADRVLALFIDRPKVKHTARLMVRSLDPEASRRLVRTALWRDPDVLFTAVAGVPKVVNALLYAADEILKQLESKLTDRMRKDLAEALLDDIDWETLEGFLERSRRLRRELSPLLDRVAPRRHREAP